jgi:hypothetical protein
VKKGRMISYVDLDDVNRDALLVLHKKMYSLCNHQSMRHLRKIKSLGEMVTTHTLRRLYTCYSFEYFGRGRLKEIGYAQYVLRHKNIETSIRYTVVQFDMTIDSVVTDRAKLSNEITKQMNDTKKMVTEEAGRLEGRIESLKRTLEEYEELVESKLKRVKRDPGVATFTVKGEGVQVKRKPRGMKKLGVPERVEAGIEMAIRLEEAGVPVNRTNLVKVGVSNDDIVLAVLGAYHKQKTK